LNFPRKRSADFHISPARLSSFALLTDNGIRKVPFHIRRAFKEFFDLFLNGPIRDTQALCKSGNGDLWIAPHEGDDFLGTFLGTCLGTCAGFH
jgi:hypothetical protein